MKTEFSKAKAASKNKNLQIIQNKHNHLSSKHAKGISKEITNASRNTKRAESEKSTIEQKLNKKTTEMVLKPHKCQQTKRISQKHKTEGILKEITNTSKTTKREFN